MYDIRLEEPAKRFLKKVDKQDRFRIIKKLKQLKDNPELGKPLIGTLSHLRALRFGKYRALYKIIKNQLIIIVLEIGHRKNIYD